MAMFNILGSSLKMLQFRAFCKCIFSGLCYAKVILEALKVHIECEGLTRIIGRILNKRV